MRADVIPFGPYNGTPVSQLPDAYLYQLVGDGPRRVLRPELEAAVEEELARRGEQRKRLRRAA